MKALSTLAVLLLLSGCFAPGTVPAAPLTGTVQRISDRHDAYIAADTSMTQTAKQQALLDTETLRMVFAEASK